MKGHIADQDEWERVFGRFRDLLFSIAYEMLRSVMDAEDIVQEAFVRWQHVQISDVRSAKAYLSALVTRLCIDHLRSARVRRETHIGPWLPESLVGQREADVLEHVTMAESVSMAVLLLLESLTPIERAVFLLHDVFGYEYSEIAPIVGQSEVYCRQIARRARRHIAERRSRFEPTSEKHDRLLEAFLRACIEGDLAGLQALLAEDVTLWADGGGEVSPFWRPECDRGHPGDHPQRDASSLGTLRSAPSTAISLVPAVPAQ